MKITIGRVRLLFMLSTVIVGAAALTGCARDLGPEDMQTSYELGQSLGALARAVQTHH